MGSYLNNKKLSAGNEGDGMAKVLIATLYSADPVLLAATRLGADRLILIISDKPTPEQDKSLQLIKDSLGRVLEIKVMKTNMYDIVAVAKKVVDIIDMITDTDRVYVNVTGGRKTMAIGALFGAYARHAKVRKIAYNTEETKDVIYLPRLSFDLTNSEKKILEYLEKGTFENMAELAKKIDMSQAMLYKSIKDLQDKDLITVEDGLKLTDAGRIAGL